MLKIKKKQKKVVNLAKNYDLNTNLPDLFDYFIPEAFSEDKSHVYLGRNTYLKTYILTAYPREIYVGWLDEFFQLGNIRITSYLENIPDNVVIKQLTSKVTNLESQRILNETRGDISQIPALTTAISDLETVREALQTNRERMFVANILVTLYAKNQEQLDDKCFEFENICSRKTILPLTFELREKEAFINSLPIGNISIFKKQRNLTTGAAACLIPITNADMSHSSGILLGNSFQTNSPVFFDRFIGPPRLPTQHIYISGRSGSGKSVTIKTIICRSTINGGIKTIIFDPEAEYRNMVVNLLGGEYLDIRAGIESGINPLDIEEQVMDNGLYIVDIFEKISDIRALIGSVIRSFAGRPLNPLEITALEEATKEIYNDLGITSDPDSLYTEGGKSVGEGQYKVGKVRKNMPILSDLHAKLMTKKNTEELCEMMKPLLKGGSLGMFDCHSTIDLKNTLVVGFNFKEIRDEFTKFFATIVLFNYTWTKFVQKDKKKKSVVLDEAWLFIKFPESAKYLEEIGRRGRKYNVSLIVGSQLIEEFISREEGRAVIYACSTMILLQQLPTVVQDIVDTFKLSEGCASLLETFSPGEAILVMNGSATAIRITPTSFEWDYVTTNPIEQVS